jgi:predicted MFS family arabinose efflux permease
MYSDSAETTAQGLRFGVTGFSQALFPAAAGVAVGVAWQFPFLLYGLAIPVALAIALGFESTPIRSGQPEREPRAQFSRSRFFQLLTNRQVVAYLLARAVVVLPFISFLTYNSLIIEQVYDGSPRQAGLVVALFSIVYAIVASQTGRLMNTFDRPATPLGVSSLLIGGGLAGFALSSSVFTALPWVLTMAIGTGVAFSLYRSVITDLAPARSRGRLVSVSESGARLVATITPLLVGSILSVAQSNVGAARALRWALVASAALAVLVSIACLAVAAGSNPVTSGMST